MTHYRSAFFLAVALSAAAPSQAQKVTIGEHVRETIQTAHPYQGTGESPLVSARIHFPEATYIAPHFAVLDLAPGDRVVVRSPDGKQARTYTGQGRQNA